VLAYNLSKTELSKKEKRISYFSNGFNYKQFLMDLKSTHILPPTFLKDGFVNPKIAQVKERWR
jgi:hypothetical protein